jgi:hypothetical protein
METAMPWMKPSTANTGGGDWMEMAEGVFRWNIGKPELKFFEGKDKPSVNFPLKLTDAEIERYTTEFGGPDAGKQQSYRPAFGGYTVGLSLGWYDQKGVFQTTMLVDFLTACFGSKNQKEARKWLESGACPELSDDMTKEEQGAAIIAWLEYVEDMEILGSIRHKEGKQGGVLARFGGPLPVGSPGTLWGAEPDYQSFGKGKLRAWMIATGGGSSAEQGIAEGAALSDAVKDETPTYSSTGHRLDDHEHVAVGMCQVCYARMFTPAEAAGVA